MMHHKEGALLEKRPRQAPGDGTRSTGAGPPSAGATVRGETHQREKKGHLHAESCSRVSGQAAGKIPSGGFYPREKGGQASAECGAGKDSRGRPVTPEVTPEWPTREGTQGDPWCWPARKKRGRPTPGEWCRLRGRAAGGAAC